MTAIPAHSPASEPTHDADGTGGLPGESPRLITDRARNRRGRREQSVFMVGRLGRRTCALALGLGIVLVGQSVPSTASAQAATVAAPIINEDIVPCSQTPGDPYVMARNVCLAWGRLQAEAITRVSMISGAPANRTLLLTRARATVRAMLWAIVEEAAAKPANMRTADETAALGWLGAVIQKHSIDTALRSLEMFDAFYRDQRPGPLSLPCTFVPPAPYQTQYPGQGKSREAFCFAGTVTDVASIGVTNKPKSDEWLRWANASVMSTKFTGASGAVARDMALQLGFLGATAAAGATGVFISSLIAAQIIATSANVAYNLKLVAAGTGYGITASGGALAIAAIAIVIAIIAIAVAIYGTIVVFDNQRPGLETALAEARKPFDMGTLLAKPSGSELAFTLFSGWLGSQGEPVAYAPTPARAASDPRFTVSTPTVASSTPVASFTTRAADGGHRTVTMQGGFWVITDAAGATSTILDLPGLDDQGRPASVRRVRLADGSFGFQTVNPDQVGKCTSESSCKPGDRIPVTRQFTVTGGDGKPRTIRYVGTQDGHDLPALTFDFDKVSSTTIGTTATFFAGVLDTKGARLRTAAISWEIGDRCLTTYSSGCPLFPPANAAPDGSPVKSVGNTADLRYAFPSSGTWWMRAKATTPAGTSASNWFTVEVANPTPTLAVTSPSGAPLCSTATTATTASCPATDTPQNFTLNGTITDLALQYEAETVTIDWGDGAVQWGASAGDLSLCPTGTSGTATSFAPCVTFGGRSGDTMTFSATHRYADDVVGARTASVTVRDTGGNQVTLSVPLAVSK